MNKSLLLSCVAALLFGQAAFGEITIQVFPSVAPNVFGSPSWAGYLANGQNSLQNTPGQDVGGSRFTDPTAYNVVSTVTPGELVATGFPSWEGLANPTGAFANELGQRLHFGVDVQATGGATFSLSELTYNMSSNDAGNSLGFAGSFGAGDAYSATRVGVTADGHILDHGESATTAVVDLFYIGVGNAFAAYESDPGATDQDKIDAQTNFIAQNIGSVSTTYTIFDGTTTLASGTATVDVVTPEPASVIMTGSGLMGLMVFLSRKRRKQ